jgi:predicted RNase H-like nuclease
LDAIAAAYVAFVACRHPERVLKIGDVEEGQITLPVSQLKEKY